MTIAETVAQLQAERDYLESVVSVQAEIIKQLSGAKLDVVYIHPYDLYELLEKYTEADMLSLPTLPVTVHTVPPGCTDIEIGDVTYRRTALIPAKTKRFAEIDALHEEARENA